MKHIFASAFACALPLAGALAQPAQFDANEQINAARTASVTFPGGLNFPLKPAWHTKIDTAYSSIPPLIANQTVYTLQNTQGGQYNLLVAADLATGATLWTKTVGYGTVVYDRNKLLFVGFDGYVQAYASGTGRPLWSTSIPGSYGVDSHPVAFQGTLYVPTTDWENSYPALQAMDEATGSVLWLTDLPFTSATNIGPTIDAADHAVIYTAPGFAASLDLGSGAINWSDYPEVANCYGTPPATSVYAREIYAPGIECTSGFVLNAKTGATISSFSSDGDAFSGSSMIVEPGTQTLSAVSAFTGNQIWSYTLPNAAFYSPIIVNGAVFAYASDGNLYALDATTGKRLQTLKPPLDGGDLSYAYMAAGQGYVLIETGNQLTAYKLGN